MVTDHGINLGPFFKIVFSTQTCYYKFFHLPVYTNIYMIVKQTDICYLCICVVGILLLFSHFLHQTLPTFWSCQLEVSLLCTLKWIGYELSTKLKLPWCEENSNMTSFWLASWVTSSLQIVLFFHVLRQQTLSTFWGAYWKCYCMLKKSPRINQHH